MSEPMYRPQSRLAPKTKGGSLEMTFQEPSSADGRFDDEIPERVPYPRDFLELKRETAAQEREARKKRTA